MTSPLQIPPSPPRAWAEIDFAALDHNLAFARQHSGQRVMTVVKANAYGHGLERLATHLDGRDIAYFGVANVHEARLLAEAGVKTPVYLLSPTFPDEREEIVARAWTPCLSAFEEINHFASLARDRGQSVEAHLALDTGMGRGGFLPDQLHEALDLLKRTPSIRLTGIGSHLPSADEDPAFTLGQFRLFDDLIGSIDTSGLFIHLGNSAGLLDYRSRTTNMVRPGLLLYGCSPLPDWQDRLRPVMTLKSRVSLVRTLPAGHGVSYGRSHVLEKDTAVATIGLGYGDGLPRNLSGKGAHVLINGQPAPLLGRVTMDQIMVNVSGLSSCHSGDEVEIFGPHLPVAKIAEWSDTIPWEIFTRLAPRVSRVYQSSES